MRIRFLETDFGRTLFTDGFVIRNCFFYVSRLIDGTVVRMPYAVLRASFDEFGMLVFFEKISFFNFKCID